MDKKIFSSSQTEEKSGATTSALQQEQNLEADKREFEAENITIEELDAEDEVLNKKFTESVYGKKSGWHKVIMALIILFLGATVAQSVQWLIDTWQEHQWIYFAFALVAFSVVFLGITALLKEWRRLVKLKRLSHLQQQSEQLLLESDVLQQDAEKGRELCLKIADNMRLDKHHEGLQRWQQQINDGHTAAEVTYLFSQNILQQVDAQAKKMISHSAAESAVIVAVSPLALVDMFFVAWRNIRLLNRIAALYGIELGYWSRIRLLRMVLFNTAFAGATELVREIGMDWLSQDITAKISARVAQGIGVGLLTARLGIKTMELCRPVAFKAEEKPKLSIIHKELIGVVKSTLFSKNKTKLKEREKLPY